jgi:predicted esterase
MLRQIVLIGHSQGGLLAKMLVIDESKPNAGTVCC